MGGSALVVGGGIGGLASALGLRRAGWDVLVLERSRSMGEVGAGISIWSNGLTALDHLGVGGAARAAGAPDVDGWIRDQAGAPLLPAGTPELRRRFDPLGVVLHRADLHGLLLDALGLDRVRLGAHVVDVGDPGEGVTAILADGGTVRADVLVAADGLHSAVRARLHGDVRPRYAGYTAWRAVVPTPVGVTLLPGESWGRGARFGHVPVPGGRVYVYATKNAPEGTRSPRSEREELRRTFQGWHDPIPALVAAIPEEDILRNDVYDRPVLRAWGRGRITLLGDAAHPMTPNLGQGACQALEDAVVLARHLATGGDVQRSLRAYEKERMPRTSRFVVASRRAGALGQWSHPVAVGIRSVVARHLLPRLQPRQLAGMLAFQG